MGEINNWSPHLYMKMNKLCLIFLGVLAIAAIVSAWDNEEDSSLSEELASSRLVRSLEDRRRKGRKGKKGSAKNAGNRRKKGRKGKKGGKGRKGRKGRNGRKGRKSQAGARSDGRASAECFEASHTIMKMWRDVISNLEKQHKRMAKQAGIGDSKHGKKGEFKSIVHKLISVGGGNMSAPSCSGSTTNAGAAQLKNLTDILHACETRVHEACNSTNFDLVNKTKLEECKVIAEDFKTAGEVCLSKTVGAKKTTTDDACACWTNSSLAMTVEAAKNCKFNDEAKAHAAALKTCKDEFIQCRKYEDDAAESIAACSTDADTLKKELAALSQNAAKVTEAQAAVKALAASRRVRRAVAAASCTDVNAVAITLTTLVIDFPSSPQVLVYSATIIASSTVVCTAAEKLSLAAVDAAFDEAVDHLNEAIEAGQSQLMTLTGTTASPADIAAAANQTVVSDPPPTGPSDLPPTGPSDPPPTGGPGPSDPPPTGPSDPPPTGPSDPTPTGPSDLPPTGDTTPGDDTTMDGTNTTPMMTTDSTTTAAMTTTMAETTTTAT